MSAKSKKSKDEQRAIAAQNLKAAQEAVKVVETEIVQDSTPMTSAPEVTSASVAPAETIAPDPDLVRKVAEFKSGDKIRFFCMKCKAAKSTKIDEIYPTAQGHKRAKGICPTCGKKVTRGHLDITPKAV